MPSPARRVLTGLAAAACALSLALPAEAAPRQSPRGADNSTQARQITSAATSAATRIKQKKTPPGRATETTRALDAALAQMVQSGATGATARVQTPALSWSGAAGLRDKDRGAPAGRQDRFRVASNTKMMIATLVLQEVDRGVWSLDQRVATVMPHLFPAHQDVTFRQLLSHTAGVPNGTAELLAAQVKDPTSEAELVAALSRDYTPQQHIDLVNAVPWTEPGKFLYSNAGYIALGMLLETQNKQPLQQLLQQRVFRPAGMKHSSYLTDPGLKGPSLAEDAWLGGSDGWMELDTFDPDVFGAAGAVLSTTEDLNSFTRALVSGRLISRPLLAQMSTSASSGALQYGLGLYRIPDPCPSAGAEPWFYGHDGAAMGTLSVAFTSADGKRSISAGAIGRDLSSVEGRWSINQVLVPMLEATCQR